MILRNFEAVCALSIIKLIIRIIRSTFICPTRCYNNSEQTKIGICCMECEKTVLVDCLFQCKEIPIQKVVQSS